MKISQKNQKKLLEIARKTLEHYLKTGKTLRFEFSNSSLTEPRGVFVTLKLNRQLRGCLGEIEARESLSKVVQRMVISAATKDPRFPPVRLSELPELEIEISVLSPLKKIKDPAEIILGKHGVIIKKGFQKGLFLPQVATETGWDKETFMGQLCTQKAGLPWNAWQTGIAEIYIFTVQGFKEND